MIQALREVDLPAAAALLDRVGLPGAVSNIARYLRWQPDGAWALFEAGTLIGTVTVLRFGRVGFVGCMGIEPAQQGHGLGRRLLEHAHSEARRAGVTTLLLEATANGRPMYERLGYVTEYETWVMRKSATTDTAAHGASSREAAADDAMASMTMPGDATTLDGELPAILELDHRATGSPRDVMIRDLVACCRGSVERTGGVERAGSLAGYGLVVGDRLGPVIASDPGAGRALVARLAAMCTVTGVPVLNEPAMAALADSGFARVWSLHRMRLGPPVESRPDFVWALASPGAG